MQLVSLIYEGSHRASYDHTSTNGALNKKKRKKDTCPSQIMIVRSLVNTAPAVFFGG